MNARERMLELSPLPTGAQARAHFLAIEQLSGYSIVDGYILELAMPIEVALSGGIEVELDTDQTIEVVLEDAIEVTLED